MDTSKLRKFAKYARRELLAQISDKLTLVLSDGSAARRESPKAVEELEKQVKELSRKELVEKVSYIWFNRFCALRFMDVNRYTRIGIVSPAEGQFQPEILAEAKLGHISEELVPAKIQKQVFALLQGTVPSTDPQAEAYRLLLVAVCNFYYTSMPYLFERIADFTELLMPDDLLSGNSILSYTREALTPNVCSDVEVIGWLYQFYISEKKDDVFEGLKRGKKIAASDIPAATQLFTPNWIVRFLLDNSIGRLWMLNRPNSRLKQQMHFYIEPERAEADFVKLTSPEEIRLCDPACGSGHLLVYAFDLLHTMYEEEGYDVADIPDRILRFNLYGIEIDERAGELASFALTMKARHRQRRFLQNPVQPNICVLKNIDFTDDELKRYTDFVGTDLFTHNLKDILFAFKHADNFGSLIRPDSSDITNILRILEQKSVSGQLLLSQTHPKVLQALTQADYLSTKYHVVIANPPYMGGKGMNTQLKSFLQQEYRDVKSDLYSAFVVRIRNLTLKGGFAGIMTPFTWMFLGSYEHLRTLLLNECTITNLVRPEYHAFFDSAYVPICAFTLFNRALRDFRGSYIDLQQFYGADVQAEKTLEAIHNPECAWFYRASALDLANIPGTPIAYWVSDRVRYLFASEKRLSDFGKTCVGLQTGDNDRFMRFWYEVDFSNIGLTPDKTGKYDGDHKWFRCNKGGAFRKWFGNNEHVVNWKDDGAEIRNFVDDNGKLRSRPQNREFYFKEGLTWSSLSSSSLSMRYLPEGSIFETKGSMYFTNDSNLLKYVLGFCNTKLVQSFLSAICPTLDFHEGPVSTLPLVVRDQESIIPLVDKAIAIAADDWASVETSLEFAELPLLDQVIRAATLHETYSALRQRWRDRTEELRCLEEQINATFIDSYELADEHKPDVHTEEVSLHGNPVFRYGKEKTSEELEQLLLAETVRQLISYAVGCMFGRYSLDKPGLILAMQGNTLTDYSQQVSNPSYEPDTDNVIPILDEDWFVDDVCEKFRKFLRVTFGEKHSEENLRFIETSIGKDIRKYFLKDFYNDHLKRYRKRPLYWLFSSPKGSFNALVYMHRYRPDTVSIVLNDYVREFRAKLESRVGHLKSIDRSTDASQTEKNKALKELDRLKKLISELDEYEKEVLFPLASERVHIDLDDGVKTNYAKLGDALKKIPGLEAQEE